jgi:hypothetical protein
MKKLPFLIFLLALIILVPAVRCDAQALPGEISRYLNKNYRGWKFSHNETGCGEKVERNYIAGFFNGDRNRDHAVKFNQGGRGYILAFLGQKAGYKPFVLHDTRGEDVKYFSLKLWKKGELYRGEGKTFRLKYDALSDYRCESDVGGIHYFQNGKFVAY